MLSSWVVDQEFKADVAIGKWQDTSASLIEAPNIMGPISKA
ncbi:hypothetical protein RchiOBHm_Chr4g0394551 [Rosa chinensis]|uniref:Uncharacterized protein n=1 Tax=Rosa chinensis TaxID=74649 RepID=A0A2P6QR91_ROSCH|nr:hypothetical protein RchiOBHm_Chr4g0394551 [Rosa chinensis]